MKHPKFTLKKTNNDKYYFQYYFTLTAKNGQVIAQSEMYNSKDAAENGIASVRVNAPQAEIIDETVEFTIKKPLSVMEKIKRFFND